MQDFQNLQTSQLVDLLVEHTAIITKLISEKKFDEEYDKHKLLVKAIQTEIDFRKTTADVTPTTSTEPPDFSTENKT
jgi:predicted amidophosphoribosyltransferase